MPEPKSQNHLALFLLILGKALGIGGLILGAVHRVAGGTLLVLDAVFIVAAITVALRVSRKQATEAASDKETLARLVREGTLKQYLRDIEAERSSDDDKRDSAPGALAAPEPAPSFLSLDDAAAAE